MKERIAIVGSRDFPDLDLVRAIVENLDPDTVVISGGARGVDSVAEEVAKARGLKCVIYRPHYASHGANATHIRNAKIIADCDRVIAFHDGLSPGTRSMIQKARRRQIPCEIHAPRRQEA